MKKFIIWSAGIFILIFVLFPFLWGLKIALSSKVELTLLPDTISLNNFIKLIKGSEFLLYLKNSIVVSVSTVFVSLLLAIPAAYSLARFRFKGKSIGNILLIFPLLPAISILIPLSSYFNSLGIYNTQASVIICNIIFNLPFAIWMIRNYILLVSGEIEESAILEGCTFTQLLFKIVLPIIIPGLIATSIFIFISAWNNYLFAAALTSSQDLRVLPQGILSFLGSWGTEWGGLTAAGIITLIPPIVLFLIFQKWFISGISGVSNK